MGRRRQSNFHLPPYVYQRHNAYHFRDPKTGLWTKIARVGEERRMREEWARRMGIDSATGTVAWWLDRFLEHRRQLLKQGKLAARTLEDNDTEVVYLKAFFGKMLPAEVLPSHVGDYLDQRGAVAWVRANREKALLSGLYAWLMRKTGTGITLNPCRGVKRNREEKRKRYVEDAELAAVTSIAVRSIWRWAWLIYRTAQRPEDCLLACARNIRSLDDGRRALRFVQGKTGKTVDVIIDAEIEAILATDSNVVDLDRPFVCTESGKPYTYDGAAAMFRRYVGVCSLKDFGPRDLRAKAATDLYIGGEPLERIQHLLGHDSVTTTEKYIKARLPNLVQPNSRQLRVQNPAAIAGEKSAV
jgi:integrase